MINKVIIDTDIGDDLDDAIAIEYAVKAQLDIVGITTVFRCTTLRAKLAKYIVSLCNREDIPVYAGENNPKITPFDEYQKIDRWLSKEEIEKVSDSHNWLPQYLKEADESIVNNGAVDFIINCALKYKKALTIIAIGPLTNIACAIEKQPDIMKNIGEIIVLGGNIDRNIKEWNMKVDPNSADIVFCSGIKIKQIGANLSWKYCVIKDNELANLYNTNNNYDKANKQMLDKYLSQPLFKGKNPCMHDSLPIFAMLHLDSITFSKYPIKIGTIGDEKGATIIEEQFNNFNNNIYFATQLDDKQFWSSLWKTLNSN